MTDPRSELREKLLELKPAVPTSDVCFNVNLNTMMPVEFRDALVAALTPPTWQQIETAPRDGTVIDVWLGDADANDQAFYCLPGTRRSCGWWWQDDKWRPVMGLRAPVFVQPTHWMPLPDPPQEPTP